MRLANWNQYGALFLDGLIRVEDDFGSHAGTHLHLLGCLFFIYFRKYVLFNIPTLRLEFANEREAADPPSGKSQISQRRRLIN